MRSPVAQRNSFMSKKKRKKYVQLDRISVQKPKELLSALTIVPQREYLEWNERGSNTIAQRLQAVPQHGHSLQHDSPHS